MNTIKTLQNNMNDIITSPRPIKETLDFSFCNAPIRRKLSFDYDVNEVQEPSNNLLLPMLDSDDEQDGPQPTLRPRREYDYFYMCNDFNMPESPMRIPPTEDDEHYSCSSSSSVASSLDDSSSYCPMPMALDDDSLSLSDNESLEGLPYAPSLARGFEETSCSNDNDDVVCQLTLRFNRPAPAIVLQPRSRTSLNTQFIFRGQELEFPTL